MRTETITTIQSVASADATTTPEHVQRVVAACRTESQKPRMGTVRDAAELLGVHPRTIQRYERLGILKAVRITSRRIRYNMNELERLAAKGLPPQQRDLSMRCGDGGAR